jgi:putative ABC transport system substrate-binding protein
MRRRDFIALIGGDAVAWPLVLRAQQATMPLIGYLSSVGRNDCPKVDDAFRQGVAEAGLIEGQSVVIEYRYADGHYDRLPPISLPCTSPSLPQCLSVGARGQGGDPAIPRHLAEPQDRREID